VSTQPPCQPDREAAPPARWQRSAAAELASILRDHGHLPAIDWTITSPGAALRGHVSGLAPPARVLEAFQTWQAALALDQDYSRTTAGIATTWLRAAAIRNHLRVTLTATIFENHHKPDR
jgi:hypothetical protein